MAKQSIEMIGLKYGIFSAIAFILFFFLMQLFGLEQIYWLRAINYVFLAIGIIIGIKEYRRKHQRSFSYMNGIAVGMITSVVSSLIFAFFIAIYLDLIDPEFMAQIKEDQMFGSYLNPYIAAAVIFLEGTLSGAFTAFVLMPYFKRSHKNETEHSVP